MDLLTKVKEILFSEIVLCITKQLRENRLKNQVMNRKAILRIVSILVLGFMACGCTDDAPAGNTHQITYEVTGNFSGKLSAVYTSPNGNTLVDEPATPLPWAKQVTYDTKVQGAGISVVSSDPAFLGSAGQTITLKISAGNKVLHNQSYTATAMGIINIPTVAFVF